jgi:hypothetical protein
LKPDTEDGREQSHHCDADGVGLPLRYTRQDDLLEHFIDAETEGHADDVGETVLYIKPGHLAFQSTYSCPYLHRMHLWAGRQATALPHKNLLDAGVGVNLSDQTTKQEGYS